MVGSFFNCLPSSQRLYDASPRCIQRLLVNLEAWKRDQFRRYGNYNAELEHYNPLWYRNDLKTQESYQVERLDLLLQVTRKYVRYYRETLPDIQISSLEDLQKIPVLEKDAVRHDPLALVHDGVSIKELWLCSTSGSTGTPLRFYHDRTVTRAHQAVADALMSMHGCYPGQPRVRFSGASVVPYERREPPFWIYVDYYRQLQCSAYHLGPKTYQHYLRAMRQFRVEYGTGYATAWHLLASYLRDSGDQAPRLKAIFTDSEGIDLEQQATIEQAFGCPVFQTYGTGEVGQVAIQCERKRYHVLTRAAIVEVLNDDNKPVNPGETGQVIVTDLASMVTPFIRYRTGDLATLALDVCQCGWQSPSWIEVVGRIDDQIETSEGRWIGRLSHVMKPGVGIRESQIAQVAVDKIVIRVVPDRNFEPVSMEAVIAAAHRYLGKNMGVSWEIVDRLPRTPSGKLRHVVRELEAPESLQ